jgi:hypothetical protein
VAQDCLELVIIQPLPPKCWDYRHDRQVHYHLSFPATFSYDI